ncbi:phosphotransferase family protein [Hamadaea tsunoensis]|uniref:phosphotransferase family protein n=1 Tax=Hamadaea tsunoensis TaxID=53368 RepID=UPI00042A7D6C|nr:phosphotransferase [Hamadaea tsunoensis]
MKLPRRLDATPEDLDRARDAAHHIAAEVLGRDPGPLTTADSMSHYVFLGAGIAVKLIGAHIHDRLDLEVTLAPRLPAGLGAPLIAAGRTEFAGTEIRYAVFTRMPGVRAGVGLPGADDATARRWAEQAVRRLHDLHRWTPDGEVEQALRKSPVHEGFVGRAALLEQIERIDRAAVVSRWLVDRLRAIAASAPSDGPAATPVHADADWGNWLVDGPDVSALLDFERARYGVPADDWILLAVTSGPHLGAVLGAIVDLTGADPLVLRAECELRDAAHIAGDVAYALEEEKVPGWLAARIGHLERLAAGRWH